MGGLVKGARELDTFLYLVDGLGTNESCGIEKRSSIAPLTENFDKFWRSGPMFFEGHSVYQDGMKGGAEADINQHAVAIFCRDLDRYFHQRTLS